jgi:hypothetical protein
MPSNPYPLQAQDFQELTRKLNLHLDELYENRAAGAIIGDVFDIDSDDVLTLTVGDGLQKSNNAVSVKTRDGYGIVSSSSGIYLKRQVHEADAAEISAVLLQAGSDNIDLTDANNKIANMRNQINNLKTTVNNILAKLENAEIFKDS